MPPATSLLINGLGLIGTGYPVTPGEFEYSQLQEMWDFDFLPNNQVRYHIITEVTLGTATFLRFRVYRGIGVVYNYNPPILVITAADITVDGKYHLELVFPKPAGAQKLYCTLESDGTALLGGIGRQTEFEP